MRFDADLYYAILFGLCDAYQNIAGLTLAFVQCRTFRLAYSARNQFPGAGDAAAIFTGDGKLKARFQRHVVNRLTCGDFKHRAAAIGERDAILLCAAHIQISDVTSPPG